MGSKEIKKSFIYKNKQGQITEKKQKLKHAAEQTHMGINGKIELWKNKKHMLKAVTLFHENGFKRCQQRV